MNRGTLQSLSRERLRDARLLLANRRFVGAYYLAGYAIECAVKACIAKQTQRHDFPNKRTTTDSYTHDLEKLIVVARLKQQLADDTSIDKEFERNWSVVNDWTAEHRYNSNISSADAKSLYKAIASRRSGVMAWLRRYW
jgi:HEPN domain